MDKEALNIPAVTAYNPDDKVTTATVPGGSFGKGLREAEALVVPVEGDFTSTTVLRNPGPSQYTPTLDATRPTLAKMGSFNTTRKSDLSLAHQAGNPALGEYADWIS